jgi:hypothetical protein
MKTLFNGFLCAQVEVNIFGEIRRSTNMDAPQFRHQSGLRRWRSGLGETSDNLIQLSQVLLWHFFDLGFNLFLRSHTLTLPD